MILYFRWYHKLVYDMQIVTYFQAIDLLELVVHLVLTKPAETKFLESRFRLKSIL